MSIVCGATVHDPFLVINPSKQYAMPCFYAHLFQSESMVKRLGRNALNIILLKTSCRIFRNK